MQLPGTEPAEPPNGTSVPHRLSIARGTAARRQRACGPRHRDRRGPEGAEGAGGGARGRPRPWPPLAPLGRAPPARASPTCSWGPPGPPRPSGALDVMGLNSLTDETKRYFASFIFFISGATVLHPFEVKSGNIISFPAGKGYWSNGCEIVVQLYTLSVIQKVFSTALPFT